MYALVRNNTVDRIITNPINAKIGDTYVTNISLLSPEARKELGIFDYIPNAYPAPYLKVINQSYQIDFSNYIVHLIYETDDKDIYLFKSSKITSLQAEAKVLLAPSNTEILESLEQNIPVPENIANYRLQVRQALTNACLDIEELTTVQAVYEYQVNWPIFN